MKKKPITVLLVDDDEDDFIIVRDLFTGIDRGYSIEWASGYDEGLSSVLQGLHDVYLVDFQMGAHNGLDLLRAAQATGCRAPMILLTGQADREVDIEAMRVGASDFLVKGELNARDLERAIRYALEHKRAEWEIQKLAAFPRHNPDPVFEFAADGRLTYYNEAASLLAQSLDRDAPADILPPDTAAIVAETLSTGKQKAEHLTSFQGRSFVWSFIPIPTSHTVHCYAKEITERLHLEAQLRHSVKMEAVGQLAAGVAHDFNNILTVIQGHASLLLESKSEDLECTRSLRQVCSAAERAGNLIRQLLMFSRKQVMQPRQLDLNEVIGNLARLLHRVLGEHIQLEFKPGLDLPAIYADTGMVEQILMNLALNARDAMPERGTLTVSTAAMELDGSVTVNNPEARPGKFVCLSVADSGCGIPMEVLSHIFEPFFTTKEIGKGTGLGLATVYGIVKQHGGWIEVQSRAGAGSVFRIFLPSSGAVTSLPSSYPSQVTVEPGHETILVVEDEPELRELVVEILQLHGYSIISACSGVAALKMWEQCKGQVDLLLTDLVMPEGVSGRELADRLLKDDPTLNVIYTSGYSPAMAGKDLSLREGINFLPKPYPPTRLIQLVRECLNNSKRKLAPSK